MDNDTLVSIKKDPEQRVVIDRLAKQILWLNYLISFSSYCVVWLAFRQKKWNYLYVMAGTQTIVLALIFGTDNIAIKRHATTVSKLVTAVYCIPRIRRSKKEALAIEEELSNSEKPV